MTTRSGLICVQIRYKEWRRLPLGLEVIALSSVAHVRVDRCHHSVIESWLSIQVVWIELFLAFAVLDDRSEHEGCYWAKASNICQVLWRLLLVVALEQLFEGAS